LWEGPSFHATHRFLNTFKQGHAGRPEKPEDLRRSAEAKRSVIHALILDHGYIPCAKAHFQVAGDSSQRRLPNRPIMRIAILRLTFTEGPPLYTAKMERFRLARRQKNHRGIRKERVLREPAASAFGARLLDVVFPAR